jgi:hypothetical protein
LVAVAHRDELFSIDPHRLSNEKWSFPHLDRLIIVHARTVNDNKSLKPT